MNVLNKDKRYSKYEYSSEAKFEADIVDSTKSFFGKNTIYINAKKNFSNSLGFL